MPKLPNYHLCFVCGDRNPSGLGVRFHTDGEKVWTHFTPDAGHMGYSGITHGGVLAALLDETMGWAPCIATRRFCMSIEVSVEFLKALPLGTPVVATGWTTDTRRRIWLAHGEIRGEDGILYARGRGRYMPMSEEQTCAVMRYLTFDEGCLAPEDVAPYCAGTAEDPSGSRAP